MKFKKIILIVILIIILIAIGVVMVISTSKNKNAGVVKESAETATSVKNDSNKIDLEITDNYFLANMSDIYLNYKDYEGKTVSYEGFVYYDTYYNSMVVARYYYCCGYDAYITGLECNYDGEKLPAEQWVKVTGTIQINSENPNDIYPYLKVNSLEIIKEGNKYVNN